MLLIAAKKRIQTPEPSSKRKTDTYGSSLAVKSISSLKHNRLLLQYFKNRQLSCLNLTILTSTKLRGYEFKLSQARLDISKNFFTVKVIDE